jgi:LysR family hydrogen peroxide-inducible transcriptional activator
VLTEHEVNVARLLLLEEGHRLRDKALAVCSSSKGSLVNSGATSMATSLQMVSHDMGMTLDEVEALAEAIMAFAPRAIRVGGLIRRGSS